MGEAPDHKDLLTALTTEHFTLQGARSQTVSESSSRAALYIGSVSSAVVALGFLGQGNQQYFTIASAIAVINSVVAGSAAAIAVGAFAQAALGPAAGVGAAVAVISLTALLKVEARLLANRSSQTDVLFPSPLPSDEPAHPMGP